MNGQLHPLSLFFPLTLTLGFYRKFGKQIQRRQLDLPEYAASFLNYKALKKVSFRMVPGVRSSFPRQLANGSATAH